VHRFPTALRTGVGGVCSQAVIHSSHRRIHPRGLTCGDGRFGMWIPRGVPVESSRNPLLVHVIAHSVHKGPFLRGELEDGSRMSVGQIPAVHSDGPFILETPSGHPHAATRSDLRRWAKSTESTVPTTTAVLLLELLLLKQGVWKVGSGAIGRTARTGPANDRQGGQRIPGAGDTRAAEQGGRPIHELPVRARREPPRRTEGCRSHSGRARVRFGVGRLCHTSVRTSSAADSAPPSRPVSVSGGADADVDEPKQITTCRDWRGQTGRWSLQA
jgi:hypothetical protein